MATATAPRKKTSKKSDRKRLGKAEAIELLAAEKPQLEKATREFIAVDGSALVAARTVGMALNRLRDQGVSNKRLETWCQKEFQLAPSSGRVCRQVAKRWAEMHAHPSKAPNTLTEARRWMRDNRDTSERRGGNRGPKPRAIASDKMATLLSKVHRLNVDQDAVLTIIEQWKSIMEGRSVTYVVKGKEAKASKKAA